MKTVECWKHWEQLLNKAMVLFLRTSSGQTSTLSWRKSLEDVNLYSSLWLFLAGLLFLFVIFAALSSPDSFWQCCTGGKMDTTIHFYSLWNICTVMTYLDGYLPELDLYLKVKASIFYFLHSSTFCQALMENQLFSLFYFSQDYFFLWSSLWAPTTLIKNVGDVFYKVGGDYKKEDALMMSI